jgi:hypothetical protein
VAREFCRNAEADRNFGLFCIVIARWHKEVCLKTKILFLLIIVVSACGSITAQNPTTQERPRRTLPTETGPPDAHAELKEVTLYWFHLPNQPDRSRSSVNLETGERGPDHARFFDLRYGGVIIGRRVSPACFLPTGLACLIADP